MDRGGVGYRTLNFPAEEWYTGFARDRVKAGTRIEDALKMVERAAQNQLAESIIVRIEGGSVVENSSSQLRSGGDRREVITTEYRQAIRTATSATMIGSDVRSYHDPETGALWAFAAVRKADLAAFYTRQIDLALDKASLEIEASHGLAAAGKKMSARQRVEEAARVLEGATAPRTMLVAVNANGAQDARGAEDALQSAREGELRQTIDRLLIDLEQSTLVYLDSSGDGTGVLADIIAQGLSENGCSVVDNRSEADYELTLTTSTTHRSGGFGQTGLISYYANAKVTLYNRMTQKRMVELSVLKDPECYSTGLTADDAIVKAFKLPKLRNKIMGPVLSTVQN